MAKVGLTRQLEVSIAVPDTGTQGPLIRTNALPLVMPSQCFRLELAATPDAAELESLENASREPISLVRADGVVWSWGAEAALRTAFGANLMDIVATDVSARLSDYAHNLFLKRLTERSIGLALSQGLPLVHRRWRDGYVLIVRDGAGDAVIALTQTVNAITGSRSLTGAIPNLLTVPTDLHPEARQVRWAEALELRLEEVDGSFWVMIRPQIWVWPPRSRRDSEAFLDARRSNRFNNKTDALMSAWIKLLLPADKKGGDHILTPYGAGASAGQPQFSLNDRTAFARRAAL